MIYLFNFSYLSSFQCVTHPPFMTISKAIIVFPLLCFLFSTISTLSPLNTSLCNETEKHALLNFKHALFDPGNRLSSWSAQEDCCGWNGVYCHNITGRVVQLHLANLCPSDSGISCDEFKLGGKVSPALLQLEFLNYLDLSFNDFGGSPIPSFLGSMRSLTYLDLSGASFGGQIPPQLGNLSNLLHLSLGGGYASAGKPVPPLYVENLGWISHLSSLESLSMYEVDLHRDVDWLESTSMLSSLFELSLVDCKLDSMSPSLGYVNFTSLTVLDLSRNYFNHEIPNWLFNLSTSLLELNLDGNSLKGHIPNTILELRYLNVLYLSFNLLTGQIPEYLGQLKHLEYVFLGFNSFDGPIPSSLGNLSSLISLYLSGNRFDGPIPSSLGNLSSLISLYLSGNRFDGPIPSFLGNLSSLISLDLGWNRFDGPIPSFLGNLSSLISLDLGWNRFDGPIPSSLGNLSSLTVLSLSGNKLNGTLPSSLWLLSNLEFLDIGNNSLADTISEVHLNKLSKLKSLYMYSTSLIFKVKSNWVPPFQLKYLWMSSCQMGPNFPTWLQTQTSLLNLDISKTGIVDRAPTWFWKWASDIEWVDASDNQMSGDLSGVWLNNTSIHLNSNRFTGLLPGLSPNVIVLNMANNSFSGPISHFLCQKLNGRSILETLDLSNNDLSGELPLCWKSWQSLTHLNLGNNKFSGKIPDSITTLFSLKALHLQNNNFSGSIPSSLRDSSSLGLLDLSGNKLAGNIPNWIGELTALKAICLRSNKFIGEIPSQICQLSNLTVLDVSDNELSGIIPRCLNNFSLMAAVDTPYDLFTDLERSNYEIYAESLVLMTVGRELEYKGILRYVRMVDLSSNNLSGSIPTELSRLAGLRFLNLSRNHLIGRIPEKIGRMTSLLSLDLSSNHLSGEIPQSLADLTFLNRLNLSYNQLRGRIPLSTQLQSFDEFSYIGNAELCGAPLPKNCTEDKEAIDENEEDSEMRWFYISMGLGFIVGFWGVCGALIFKKNWRYAYFQFLYDIKDWVYVGIATRLNRFRNNLRSLLGKKDD